MAEVTRWLNDSKNSSHDEETFNELYAELRKIARSRMRGEREGHTLDATALVHEAWMRLQKSLPEAWRDRRQFYGAAAEAMRRILVESARRRLTEKRGKGQGSAAEDIDEVLIGSNLSDDRLLEVHEVLDRLEAVDEMEAQIVKLRFFGGFKNPEIAALLEVSDKTVRRNWASAKVWLYRALEDKE